MEDLGFSSENRVHYQPLPWLTLARTLMPSEITPSDVFIDFGCGMGRMLLEAALLYPFGRVIGVELSPDLAAVAQANIERNRKRLRAREVEIVVSDVLQYRVPDDVSVAFFFNPFTGPVFAHVVRELIASVDRAPRRLRIIYRNPREERLLLDTGRIRRVVTARSRLPHTRHTAIYAVECR